MTPAQLAHKHAAPLTERLHTLHPLKQLEIAEHVLEHGFPEIATALEVNAPELEACMARCNYARCARCEEWREADSLQSVDEPNAETGEPTATAPICADCRGE